MGKDQKQTVNTNQTSTSSGASTSGIDSNSQSYIENFLRPLGQQAAQNILGGGQLFGGPTQTFQGGVQGLQGVMQGLGGMVGQDFNSALRDFQAQNPGDGGAMDVYRSHLEQTGGAGNLGFNAQRFDPSQAQQFFSPFEDQVVGGIQANADRQRDQAASRAASEATAQGAFGGSRSGILQAESLRNVNQDEASQVANVKNQGFQTAMQQAMGAHQGHQNTALGAARARMQGQLQNAGRMGALGMQAAGLGQRGKMHMNDVGLQQALGMQGGQIAAGAQGLQALGQQAGVGQQLIGAGEMERQIGNQQAQEDLFKHQQAMGFAQGGYGGPTGQTNTFQQHNRTQGQTQQVQEGNLFKDLMGGAMTLGGLGAFGPIGGALGGLFGGGQQAAQVPGANPSTASGMTFPTLSGNFLQPPTSLPTLNMTSR